MSWHGVGITRKWALRMREIFLLGQTGAGGMIIAHVGAANGRASVIKFPSRNENEIIRNLEASNNYQMHFS
jgi:hypothetical protein